MVVPGSGLVKEQAEEEGLDKIFLEAGFEWREPGCSMCLAMNADKLEPGERCASTSNRNFEGRQGRGGRTHLVSPAMAAAAAIAGHLADVREFQSNKGDRVLRVATLCGESCTCARTCGVKRVLRRARSISKQTGSITIRCDGAEPNSNGSSDKYQCIDIERRQAYAVRGTERCASQHRNPDESKRVAMGLMPATERRIRLAIAAAFLADDAAATEPWTG